MPLIWDTDGGPKSGCLMSPHRIFPSNCVNMFLSWGSSDQQVLLGGNYDHLLQFDRLRLEGVFKCPFSGISTLIYWWMNNVIFCVIVWEYNSFVQIWILSCFYLHELANNRYIWFQFSLLSTMCVFAIWDHVYVASKCSFDNKAGFMSCIKFSTVSKVVRSFRLDSGSRHFFDVRRYFFDLFVVLNFLVFTCC